MRLVPIGEIIKVSSGSGLTAKMMAPNGKYPVYGGNGVNGHHDSYLFEEPKVIIGRVGVYCGVVHLTEPNSWITDNALYVKEFLQPVDQNYLIRALTMANLNQYANQAAQPLISGSRIYPVEIPLPPLAEQKRIAGILDAADKLRAKRRESIAQLDTLLQSTFLDMFGDPVTNPMGWDVVRSSELFAVPPRIGTTTPAKGKGVIVVRVGEVGGDEIVFERCGRVEINVNDFEKYKLHDGDTVIARAIGSKNQLGKASYFNGFKEPVVIDSHVMRIRPDRQKVDPSWFYSLISSERGKLILQRAGGATAVQFNINARQASSLEIALPPLILQKDFAKARERMAAVYDACRLHLEQLDNLFNSLQQRAFNGTL